MNTGQFSDNFIFLEASDFGVIIKKFQFPIPRTITKLIFLIKFGVCGYVIDLHPSFKF